jgi:hypothetical protein
MLTEMQLTVGPVGHRGQNFTHSNQQISQREIIKLLQDDCIISLYLAINIQKYK